MKAILGILLSVFLLTSCASNSRYQSEQNPEQWKGRNISELESAWGMPDQTLYARNGNAVYAYGAKSTAYYFNSMTASNGGSRGAGVYGQYNNSELMCYSIFETDKAGTIVKVGHKGNNCGGEWVARK